MQIEIRKKTRKKLKKKKNPVKMGPNSTGSKTAHIHTAYKKITTWYLVRNIGKYFWALKWNTRISKLFFSTPHEFASCRAMRGKFDRYLIVYIYICSKTNFNITLSIMGIISGLQELAFLIYAFYSAGQPKTPVDSWECSPDFSESFPEQFPVSSGS